MVTNIEALIGKMEQSRMALDAAVERITPQVEIYPTWKLKQVLDHIAGWDELTLSAIQAYVKGETPPVKVEHGINRFNAESVAKRKGLSMNESRQAFHDLRAQVIKALRNMPPVMVSQRFEAPWGGMCTIPSVVKIFVSHELEHAKQIEEVLANSKP